MTTDTTIEPTQLPTTVRAYLAAHRDGKGEAALPLFAPSAVVVDDGHTYRGTHEVLEFLSKAGGRFTYTTELVGARRTNDTHWVAVNRLEGDFPGGVVELAFRFTLVDDLIAELVIAP